MWRHRFATQIPASLVVFFGLGAAGGCSSITPVASCRISSDVQLSANIPTVATVRWRVNGVVAKDAHIEFERDDGAGQPLIAPAPLNDSSPHEALLLGMKAGSTYRYTIHVNDDECVSEPEQITTGPAEPMLPRLNFELGEELTPGFYILSSGFGADVPGWSASKYIVIIDQDGDPVWWHLARLAISRATMDWEGDHMYMLALNVGGGGGSLSRVNMDGSDARPINAIPEGHHDFTVTPGGRAVVIVHKEKSDAVVEYDPEAGEVRTLVDDVASLYVKGTPEYHANSITYRRDDDSFILGDRYPNLYVKFDRAGELKWQFGGDAALGPAFSGTGTWNANHGHHWTGDGHFLVFNNNGTSTSRVLDFAVDESTLEARLLRQFSVDGLSSLVLGDVQRLPNGHVLSTLSTGGRLVEFEASGEVAASIKSSTSFGYTMYRKTLYGEPDK